MSEKKEAPHEEHVDETWLIPYADLLTLLLALFIVLFASSNVDAQKFQAMMESFNSAFNAGSGIVGVAPSTDQDIPTETPNQTDALKEMKAEIDQYIQQNNLSKTFKTALSNNFLMLTIQDDILFGSGSAEVKIESKETLTTLGKLLVQYPQYEILIIGHTDNVPMHTAQFPSNWELSSQRALNFMKFLLENRELDPRRFGAIGYAEFRPIASNDSAKGRAKNRRVEIAIKKTILD